MPDSETLSLVALVAIGFVAVLVALDVVVNGRRRRQAKLDPVARRREHAVAARKNTSLALVCVGLLVLALLLGRLLLGVMAITGLVVFGALSVVRGRLSR